MGRNRQPTAHLLTSVPRAQALEKWSAWWYAFVADRFDGRPSRAAETIFGRTENGQIASNAQANKWMHPERNALPGDETFEKIMKFAKIKKADWEKVILQHNLPIPPEPIKRGGYSGAKKKGNGASAPEQPVFTIDNPEVPKPQLNFHSSEKFDDLYEFEMKAVLPLSGVLALMAMLDDAH